jgi:hypothetical protein
MVYWLLEFTVGLNLEKKSFRNSRAASRDRLAAMNSRSKEALSNLEQHLLLGRTMEFGVASAGQTLRYRGLIAIAMGQDLEAVELFRRSKDLFATDSLDRAVSERLYGLALIRVQREVEGTFALERADPILERQGYAPFTLE